jgi:Zn-dependent metalloprotease
MRKIVISLVVSISFLIVNAETTVYKGKEANDIVTNSEIVRIKDFSSIPNYVKFKEGKELPLVKLEAWLNSFYKSDEKFGLKLLKEEKDQIGYTHYRFQQIINGVPVQHGVYFAHVKNGMVVSINGELFDKSASGTSISLSESVALNKALNYFGADTYKWELPAEENTLKYELEDPSATYFPKGELVYVTKNGRLNEELILTYRFNIYAQKPFGRREIYVNANNGSIVWEENKIHEADVTGTATTLYSGTQTIVSDDSQGPFRLRETGRGNGIRTYSSDNIPGGSYPNTDITNGSATWTTPDAGLDAHWGAEMTYDYFMNEHGRNSIDGNGFALVSHVHYDDGYSNAFWDGQRMTYGDGAGNNSPFTALDIAGHEITHGVITNSANLVYQGESGALNESFADIFGISVDFINRPGVADWVLGDDLGFIIRDMENPNSQGDPNTYAGFQWASTAQGAPDNGGVHINSAIQNLWFVLLTDGGTGTNDNGDNYTVNQLGLTVAGQVAYRNLTVYLTQSSDYDDARFFAIQSTVDLFGGCTSQVQEVTNAWYAVGVGPIYSAVTVSDFDAPIMTSCSIPFTANFNNISVNGSTYAWDFGDGNTSTQNNPSNTYTGYGTFTVELIADGGPSCGVDTATKLAYIVIDSTLPCVTILPTNGTITETACAGIIYDSGGPGSNYGANEDVEITISPVGASSVDLTFVSFDVELGSNNNCDYDYVEVYDGPTTGSPLIDRYCNDNIPTTVSSSNGSITIVFHSDPGLEESGFQIDWQCNISSQAPTSDFGSDVDTTCTGIINFSDMSNNGPISWAWDFGDGVGTSTQQNPTYTYTSNGLYTVQLTASNLIGSDVAIKTNYIYVNLPAAPTASNVAICDNNSASLSASGSGVLDWYSSATGGTSINTGGSYNTPVLSTTTTYYVEDVIVAPTLNLGKTDNTGSGANFNNQQYLIFDVFKSMEIIDVQVYSGASGVRTIELRSNTGAVLQSKVVAINGTGQQTVTLNFMVGPGTNYQLGLATSTPSIDLYRNDGGVNYPYTLNGIGSVTGSSAGGGSFYYFFYDWNVKENDCVSPRTPVTVTVNALPTVTANATATAICAGDPVTLTGSGATSYSWNNGVTNGSAFNPSSSVTYTVTGTDGNSCSNQDQITVTVNALPTVTANATATAICAGDPVTLTGSGATSYSWNNGVTNGSAFNPSSSVTYTVTGTDGNNCQSIDQITVTVGTVDATTNTVGNTITANASGATYQWIDCNSGNPIVPAETGQSYTPTANGDYAVIVTQGGCTDTSSCVNMMVTGIDNLGNEVSINSFFNSSNNIELNMDNVEKGTYNLLVLNSLGQVVVSDKVFVSSTQQTETVKLRNKAKGVYYIKLFNTNTNYTNKLVR